MSQDLSNQPQMVTVEARAHGWRLDYYLSRLYPNYSRSLLQRAIDEDAVLLNGLTVKPARRLRVNDRISIQLPPEPDRSLKPENIPLQIIFEDEHIAVINKPANMVTHPSKGNFTGTLAAAVQFHFDKLSDVAGQLRPGIVHRLDRDTTGVIVIAKNNQVHHRLTRQFEQREIEKEYRALVYGVMPLDGDVIQTHLRIHPKVREKMMVCPADEPNARQAVTRYEVLERFNGYSYVRLFPKTGRTHQLRVHLLHLRHPIVADKLYASRGELRVDELAFDRSCLVFGAENRTEITKHGRQDTRFCHASSIEPENGILISRQALHAFRITFRHPASERIMEFEAPLPQDMQQTLNALQTYGVR